MPNVTDTNGCTALSPSPLLFHFLSVFIHISLIFQSSIFSSPHFISASLFLSPLHPITLPLLCFSHPPISFSVCHLLEKTNNCSILWSQLVTLGELHLAFRLCPSRDSVASWLQKHGRVWKVKGFSVWNSRPAFVLISPGKDTPESVSVSVSFPVTYE